MPAVRPGSAQSCAPDPGFALGQRDLVAVHHAEVGLAGIQIEADVAHAELVAEDLLRPLLDGVCNPASQDEHDVRATVEDLVVALAGFAQFVDGFLRHARRLPRVGHDLRQPSGEPGQLEGLVDGHRPRRHDNRRGVADVHGGGLAAGNVGRAVVGCFNAHGVPVDEGQDVSPIVQLGPILAFFVKHQRQEDVLVAEGCASLYGNALQNILRGRHLLRNARQALGFESVLHLGDRGADADVPAVDVALVESRNACPPSVGLAHDAAHQLSQRALGSGVVEHDKQVGEGTIPALHQGRLGDDTPHGGVLG